MKITIDMRSLVMGFCAAGLLFMAISFKNGETESKGAYRTTMSEKGIVILNTETGDYIITPLIEFSGRVQWMKGNFANTYRNAIADSKPPK